MKGKGGTAAREILTVVLFFHAARWVSWLWHAFVVDPSAVRERDWWTLREVARSFVAGDWGAVYVDRALSNGTNFFRYPPFVLYLIAPLAAIPPLAAYAVVCAIQLVAAVVILLLLFRIRRPREAELNVAAVLGSAAMAHVIVSGQNSALLALVIAAAAYFWAVGRNSAAGVCVGLLACKPNWLPVFGLFALWRGGLKAGLAAAITGAALVISTLPLGVGLWKAFFAMTTRAGEIGTRYSLYKEITLLAALRSVLGWGTLTTIVWAGSVAIATVLVIRALRQGRPLGRSIASITLLAVIANPYVSFYDGFVLVVPATLWYAHRGTYSDRAWRSVGMWIGAYWVWDMAVFYYASVVPIFRNPHVSAAGFLVTGWLVTEAVAVAGAEEAVIDMSHPRPRIRQRQSAGDEPGQPSSLARFSWIVRARSQWQGWRHSEGERSVAIRAARDRSCSSTTRSLRT